MYLGDTQDYSEKIPLLHKQRAQAKPELFVLS